MARWRLLFGLVILPLFVLALTVQPSPAFQDDSPEPQEQVPTPTPPLPAATAAPAPPATLTPAPVEPPDEGVPPEPEIDWTSLELMQEAQHVPLAPQAMPGPETELAPLPAAPAPAPAAPAAPPPETTGTITHVVARGDNLSRIAARYGVTVEALKVINQLTNVDLIHVGQLILIPAGGVTAAAAPVTAPSASEPSAPSGSGQVYVVRLGDSVYKIARRFGTTVQAVVAANQLANPRVVYAGQQLLIPGSEDAVVVAATVTPEAVATTATPEVAGDGESYVVRPGDTAYKIAVRFGTTVRELAAANNLANANVLKVGQVLRIVRGSGATASEPAVTPVPVAATELVAAATTDSAPAPAGGEQYVVQAGDSLYKIALRTGTTVQAIAAANSLTNLNRLQVGMTLTIPEATSSPAPAADPAATAGTFVWPVQGRILNWYRYGHSAIDIEAVVGTEIVAAAAGVVEFASWNTAGYGNLTIIDHGNGVKTLYAHQSAFLVEPGQQVEQGQVIGKSGSTGWSNWPHVHLEIIINLRRVDPCGQLAGGC